MAWTLTAHTTGSNLPTGAGSYTTSAIDTRGAVLLVVSVSYFAGGTVSISDSLNGGTGWVKLTERSGGNNREIICYNLSPTVGAAQTFTVAGVSFSSCNVSAFGGVTSPAFDQENGAGNGSTGTQQPGSVTPGSNGELLVTGLGFGDAAGSSVSIDSGYSITDQLFDGTQTVFSTAMAYLVQGTAGASNPTWTLSSGTERMTAAIATFSGTSAGGSVIPLASYYDLLLRPQ